MRIERKTSPPKKWNEWIRQGMGGPYQTRQFADYWSAILGYRPLFLVVGEPERPLGALLAFQYSPLQRKLYEKRGSRQIHALTWPLIRSIGSIDGPAICQSCNRREVVSALFAELRQCAGFAGGVRWKSTCHWEMSGEEEGSGDRNIGKGIREDKGFTPVVRLGQNLDEAWRCMPKEGRKAVRRAERQGITIRCLDGGDIKEAHEFWQLCDRAKGGKSYGDRLPEMSSRYLAEEDFHVRYFIASHEGSPIAGLGLHAFGGIACEIAAWSTPESVAAHLGGGDAIKWAVIKWCIEHKVVVYDLMGIVQPPRNSKEEGIGRFKKKWTKEIIPLNSLRTVMAILPP